MVQPYHLILLYVPAIRRQPNPRGMQNKLEHSACPQRWRFGLVKHSSFVLVLIALLFFDLTRELFCEFAGGDVLHTLS
jgi:hypothetical protein